MLKPFIKWVGGKSRLLGNLKSHFPLQFNKYYEPFLGGGSVFFGLDVPNPIISDVNEKLITAYRTVRDRPEELFDLLNGFADRHSEEFFYKTREHFNNLFSSNSLQLAAAFLYLNKTCYNGLYRVNRKGAFNSPFNKSSVQPKWSLDHLQACSAALKKAKLDTCSYEEINARSSDFVYLDPPYDKTYNAYQSGAFNWHKKGVFCQERLAEFCQSLHNRGVKFLLSNSKTNLILDLYKQFNIFEIEAPRSVSRDGAKRGSVVELLIKNY